MLFSFGTNISEVDNLDNDFCGTVFTICDTANPDDISGFGQCMNRNGCSGGTVITEAQ